MAVAHARTRTRTRTTLLRGLSAVDSPRAALLAPASLQNASAVEQEVLEEVRERAAAEMYADLLPQADGTVHRWGG